MKKLDNYPMLCSKCEYNHDMIINKCLAFKGFKRATKSMYFSMSLYQPVSLELHLH